MLEGYKQINGKYFSSAPELASGIPSRGDDSMGVKTVLVVAVTTAKMFFPGMPDMPDIPGMKAPNLNAPTKTLTMDLTSDKKVDAKSKAECAVPEGLKLGPKVKLAIDLPVKVKDDEGLAKDDEEPTKPKKFVIKQYWGCSETIRPGQPRILDSSQMMKGFSMNPQMMKQFQNAAQKMIAEADNSHAYWPGMDGKQIVKDSVTPGDYELTTNYCGGTTFSLGTAQDFLAPIELIGFGEEINLAKAIKVQWKPVSEAKGYLLMAFSGSEDEMILWTSSEDPDAQMGLTSEAITKEQLKKYLDQCILIPPDVTTCSIPAGIFKDAQAPMLMVTAFGADKIQEKDGIETQIVVRSNLTAMLGGSPFGDNGYKKPGKIYDGDTEDDSAITNDDAADSNNSDDSNKPAKEEKPIKKIGKKLKDLLK
jgi:hypothetical protein